MCALSRNLIQKESADCFLFHVRPIDALTVLFDYDYPGIFLMESLSIFIEVLSSHNACRDL